jgi:hypothetical protein
MPDQQPKTPRTELEEIYVAWARVCEDKHGLPWPIPVDRIQAASDLELQQEVKKLKDLGRIPHE